jgi:hypothetical protein
MYIMKIGEKTKKNLNFNRALSDIKIIPATPNPIMTALNKINFTQKEN